MSDALERLLKECEADVRAGQLQKAARALAHLNTAEVPRRLLLPFANLARRTGGYNLGLRLLSPLLYEDRNKWREKPTDKELAEYAVLLQKCGAVGEALQILSRIRAESVPETLLYRAFCHFNRWEYVESIPLLEQYLKADLAPYPALVGRVNLSAALLSAERHDQASALLEETIAQTEREKHFRLLANCLEMRAQLRIFSQHYSLAGADLERAVQLLGVQSTFDQLYIQKWQAVVQAFRAKSTTPLTEFARQAAAMNNWECLREADLHRLKLEFELDTFDRLVFGTPFRAYRERICRYLGKTEDREEYWYGDRNGKVFDLMNGEVNGEPVLNGGKKIHQVLAVLMRDLYAPMKVGALFAEIFPGDHFDINSSPDRLHQVLRRTRRWIAQSKLPFDLRFADGYYSLRVGTGLCVRLPLHQQQVSTHALEFERLRRMLPPEFTRRQACAKLGLTLSSFNALINWSLEQNLVERHGQGRAVKYRLSQNENKRSENIRIAS